MVMRPKGPPPERARKRLRGEVPAMRVSFQGDAHLAVEFRHWAETWARRQQRARPLAIGAMATTAVELPYAKFHVTLRRINRNLDILQIRATGGGWRAIFECGLLCYEPIFLNGACLVDDEAAAIPTPSHYRDGPLLSHVALGKAAVIDRVKIAAGGQVTSEVRGGTPQETLTWLAYGQLLSALDEEQAIQLLVTIKRHLIAQYAAPSEYSGLMRQAMQSLLGCDRDLIELDYGLGCGPFAAAWGDIKVAQDTGIYRDAQYQYWWLVIQRLPDETRLCAHRIRFTAGGEAIRKTLAGEQDKERRAQLQALLFSQIRRPPEGLVVGSEDFPVVATLPYRAITPVPGTQLLWSYQFGWGDTIRAGILHGEEHYDGFHLTGIDTEYVEHSIRRSDGGDGEDVWDFNRLVYESGDFIPKWGDHYFTYHYYHIGLRQVVAASYWMKPGGTFTQDAAYANERPVHPLGFNGADVFEVLRLSYEERSLNVPASSRPLPLGYPCGGGTFISGYGTDGTRVTQVIVGEIGAGASAAPTNVHEQVHGGNRSWTEARWTHAGAGGEAGTGAGSTPWPAPFDKRCDGSAISSNGDGPCAEGQVACSEYTEGGFYKHGWNCVRGSGSYRDTYEILVGTAGDVCIVKPHRECEAAYLIWYSLRERVYSVNGTSGTITAISGTYWGYDETGKIRVNYYSAGLNGSLANSGTSYSESSHTKKAIAAAYYLGSRLGDPVQNFYEEANLFAAEALSDEAERWLDVFQNLPFSGGISLFANTLMATKNADGQADSVYQHNLEFGRLSVTGDLFQHGELPDGYNGVWIGHGGVDLPPGQGG